MELMVMDEQIDPPKVIIDAEDTKDLLVDCYDFLTRVLDRSNPKWISSEGDKLVKKLEEVMCWYKLH